LVLHSDEGNEQLEIRLEFDHYKQLEILLDDYCAVVKRRKDLEKVERFLHFQNYKPVIYLNYYLSNNPIKIIEDFLNKNNLTVQDLKEEMKDTQNGDEKGKKKMQEFLDKVECYIGDPQKLKKDFGDELETDILRYGAKAADFVEQYLGQIHSIMKLERKLNDKS